jgi:hypothetical protein
MKLFISILETIGWGRNGEHAALDSTKLKFYIAIYFLANKGNK